MKTCLNRLIGRCENRCQRDYNATHHPNNYDCVNYREVNVLEFTASKKILEQKAKELSIK
jgi:hypothetical protein